MLGIRDLTPEQQESAKKLFEKKGHYNQTSRILEPAEKQRFDAFYNSIV